MPGIMKRNVNEMDQRRFPKTTTCDQTGVASQH
jgi:hypothetical protein